MAWPSPDSACLPDPARHSAPARRHLVSAATCPCSVRLRLHRQAHQRSEHGGEISVDKYELVERYEALGDENDFLAAKQLFEQELTGHVGALDRRQYGYLLECHGRRALRRAVGQYEQAMSLDPDQDKVQYQ